MMDRPLVTTFIWLHINQGIVAKLVFTVSTTNHKSLYKAIARTPSLIHPRVTRAHNLYWTMCVTEQHRTKCDGYPPGSCDNQRLGACENIQCSEVRKKRQAFGGCGKITIRHVEGTGSYMCDECEREQNRDRKKRR